MRIDHLRDWVQEAMQKPGIAMVPLSSDISIESTMLPVVMHGDPADRIIIATARIKKYSLATHDKKIHQYSWQGHVAVIKV